MRAKYIMEIQPILKHDREKYWKYYPNTMMAFKVLFIKKAEEKCALKSVFDPRQPIKGDLTGKEEEETWWFSLNQHQEIDKKIEGPDLETWVGNIALVAQKHNPKFRSTTIVTNSIARVQ